MDRDRCDRRQHTDLSELQLENRFRHLTVSILHLDTVQPFAANFVHLFGDGVQTVSSKPIHAGAQKKVCSGLPSRTEQLVDVALAVADVYAARGISEQ